MKKDTSAPDGGDGTIPAADTPAEVTDTAAREGENHFDAKHEWPTAGGCYVRQTDGTLKRED